MMPTRSEVTASSTADGNPASAAAVRRYLDNSPCITSFELAKSLALDCSASLASVR